jgi:hypothetical protein
MSDYSAVMRFLDARKIPDYTLHLKSLKRVNVFIPQLPGDTPAEDTSDELMALAYSVISVRQVTATLPEPKAGNRTSNIPLFMMTLTRNDKAMEIFKLTSLVHVVIKVQAYRAQRGIMQCYKYKKFDHVCANCRQHPPPPRCL